MANLHVIDIVVQPNSLSVVQCYRDFEMTTITNPCNAPCQILEKFLTRIDNLTTGRIYTRMGGTL